MIFKKIEFNFDLINQWLTLTIKVLNWINDFLKLVNLI